MTATLTPLPAAEALSSILAPNPVLVTFRKRTTGEVRTMLCQARETPVRLLRRGLVQVWDLDKEGVRLIPFEDVSSVRSLPSA